MARVLVVDDDGAIAFALSRSLAGVGHDVEAVPDAERALVRLAAESFDLVLLDVLLPGMNGLDALLAIHAARPAVPVVVLTAHGSASTAMEALARGAYDHLTKPVELATLRRTVAEALAPRPHVPRRQTDGFVGRSSGMQAVGKRIGILAHSDASVLILGETGTGKEHVARAIHERSARRAAPFVPVTCAALPEALLEAELFGATKGSFTGAASDRVGKIEAARGGTLFLDEIGEVSLAAQVKLLRFLEDRCVQRLGDNAPRAVDVRVIAATNADLEARVRDGRFREDLYFRLNVVTITLPPLRERREDLPLLVEHFLARAGVPIAPEALERLVAARWPGNVRELRNALEHAVALSRGALIQLEHLPRSLLETGAPASTETLEAAVVRLVVESAGAPGLHETLIAAVERAAIGKALELARGNQVAATKILDMNRATFRKRMGDFGLLERHGW